MHSFKKVILIVLVTLSVANFAFADERDNAISISKTSWNGYSLGPTINENVIEKDVIDMVKKYVPSKYVGCFLYYTDDENRDIRDDLRKRLIATGWVESEWKPVIGKRNKNGTRDIGYLQLNSANISNKDFIDSFGPKESDLYVRDTDDIMELYLIVCINYYKALYKAYGGDNAFYAYNCGEPRFLKNRIPATTISYQKKILNKLESIDSEVDACRIARIEKDKRFMIACRERAEKIQLVSKNLHALSKNNDRSSVSQYDVIAILQDDMDIILSKIKSFRPYEENPKYKYVGMYRKNTGAVAPVFKNLITGGFVYC